jgi:hypothetical protein
VSSDADLVYLIDDLVHDHWEHPVTEGMPPFYWREPATRSYRVKLRG